MASPRYFGLHVTDHCNLNCNHCSHFSNKRPTKFYSPENYYPSLDILVEKDKIGILGLTGGEPFLHKELPKFVSEIRSRYRSLKLILLTNGFWIKNPTPYKDMFKHLDALQISKYPKVIQDIGEDHYYSSINFIRNYVQVRHLMKDTINKFFKIEFSEEPIKPDAKCPYVNCTQILTNKKLMRCPIGYGMPSYIPQQGLFYDFNKDNMSELSKWKKVFPFNACYYCRCYHVAENWQIRRPLFL